MITRLDERDALTDLLPLRKFIIHFSSKTKVAEFGQLGSDDPSVLLNVACLLNIVQIDLPERMSDVRDIRPLTLVAMTRLAEKWVVSSEHQIAALRQLFSEILGFIDSLSPNLVRVVLLEFPIGNVIPVLLLERLLRGRDLRVERLTVSLSRNDSHRHGVTRAELLQERFETFGVTQNDLVVYLDEWLTGSNFYNLVVKLYKLTKDRGAYLLPAAAVAESAPVEGRYQTFCDAHDSACDRLGVEGKRFRVAFPVLNFECRSDQEFFWSENDRLAGYRKMQFFGAIFSSIVGIVEDIHRDERLRSAVRLRFLEVGAMGRVVDETAIAQAVQDNRVFTEFFEEGYQDFVSWSQEAATLAFASNLGVISDSDAAFEEITTRLTEMLRGRPAERCVKLALVWAQVGEVDPRNQHHFRGHVPVVSRLDDELLPLHHAFLEALAMSLAATAEASGSPGQP